MAVIENDGTISLVNTLFLSLLGYHREDVENRINIFSFFDERFRDQAQDYHRRRRIVDSTVPHRYETQIVSSDGKILDVIIMIGLFPGTGQSVASIIDITDRKRIEDELRMFKASVDHANDEIFWLSFDASILYVNDAAIRVTGVQEELLAMKVFELNPHINPDIWAGFMKGLGKTGSCTSRPCTGGRTGRSWMSRSWQTTSRGRAPNTASPLSGTSPIASVSNAIFFIKMKN